MQWSWQACDGVGRHAMELAGTIKLGAFGWCNTVNGPGRDWKGGRGVNNIYFKLVLYYLQYCLD